ncbi:LPS export ABC transporter periplasmic protein LptC [Comamonas serinivorans]|uniref:LPS export ABC transporter periplasmic protein LptC n=1 Tax=Comamonas serinivorans TaxID=1082851 RepID=A0A1Y0EIN0_9BURK|nr:LPS export ABC transporter periplasmic protein LptC [Comamonas serinivorans]ARU03310.1 LPS export ABC transporter periplasmic protein LptC [Comamonas serinivorans]
MRWRNLRDQATSQLGIYLPVLVMALIALGSWWLLRNAPSYDMAAPPKVVRHEPDYFMRDFEVQQYSAAGQLNNQLQGREMLHYPDTDSFTIDQPVFVDRDEQGRRMDAHAKRGTSNQDGSVIELFDDAHVRRVAPDASEPPLSFAGNHLRVFADDKRVESDQSVVLTRGQQVFKGGTLRYDHTSGQAQLGEPVTAMLPGQRQP